MKRNNNQISIVVSNFYPELTESLLRDCMNQLVNRGIENNLISVYKVSGTFEIPGTVSSLLKHQSPSAIITLGVIIKGETPHFDFISTSCSNSISQLTIDNDLPITFGILTTNTYKQALKRAEEKGVDIADTTIQSLDTYNQIKSN